MVCLRGWWRRWSKGSVSLRMLDVLKNDGEGRLGKDAAVTGRGEAGAAERWKRKRKMKMMRTSLRKRKRSASYHLCYFPFGGMTRSSGVYCRYLGVRCYHSYSIASPAFMVQLYLLFFLAIF